jgi:hypothetical protein
VKKENLEIRRLEDWETWGFGDLGIWRFGDFVKGNGFTKDSKNITSVTPTPIDHFKTG